MKIKRAILFMAAVLLVFVSMSGCQSENDYVSAASRVSNNKTSGNSDISAEAKPEQGQAAAVINLEGSSITADGSVTVEGGTATITNSGSYIVTGKLDDGQIVVDATGSVNLTLRNADICSLSSAPIFIKEAKNVTVTLEEGTENILTDGSSYDLEGGETEPDAALYSNADLIIDGSGTLTVNANYNDGIASRDTLRIDSGNILLSAIGHGIKGKDYLMINDGNIIISSSEDGIKATNDTETSMGYVEINGGSLELTAKDEAVSAISSVKITGGNLVINTDNNGIKSEDVIDISGGTVEIKTMDDGLVCAQKNIASQANVTVNGVRQQA